MSLTSSPISLRRHITVLLFTWAAGSLDALVYLTGHVFPANMTGNLVLLGISVGQAHGIAAARSIIALVTFAPGVIVAAMLVGEGDKPKRWTLVRRAVLVEAVVLVLFSVLALVPLSERAALPLLIALSSFAMGLQSAIVKRLNLPGIATTYITGTITNLFFGLAHRVGREMKKAPVAAPDYSLRLQAAVFITYAQAAIVSGALYLRWPREVAFFPIIAVGSVAVYMYLRHRRLLRDLHTRAMRTELNRAS